ncbi:probable LRR receptor-like serine/threonine-protein kinase At1g67720 [Cryptomeria japonica]|uniref:probable LRR receptor-like serine/threonine-protein kinase At1g67720 n=1 Tax=Cryptomeria japonica TaxID=3369 RepID=UPI0027DA64D9|nr:probable LRR receptor-like serine/threonine-protein kinase At1g67720 [Cryptomeria japonica]
MDKLIFTGRSLLTLTANVLAFLVSVSGQPGFLSINCGGVNNYTDSATNVTWSSDGNYIDVGEAASVSNSSIPFHLQSLRYFSRPLKKSCYSLPLDINVTYLLRLWFVFGNYNGIQTLPSFNVSFETQGMLYQKTQSISSPEIPEFTRERIFTSSSNVLYVCLIRTSDSSDPFISAIELRSLSGGLYEAQVKPGILLSTIARYDLGVQFSDYMSLWFGQYKEVQIGKAHTNRMVLKHNNNITSFPPAAVMQTAVIDETPESRILFTLESQDTRTLFVLYFAEVEELNSSEARNFDVTANEQTVQSIHNALQNHSIELPFTYNYTQEKEVVISLETAYQAGKSNRGPLLNALEYYKIMEREPETYPGDVDALLSIKKAFGIKGWISDPCFAIEWTGIICNGGLSVRILSIDLSERNLYGTLPQRISQLTELRSIYLQNNSLSGTLPDLCSLTKLQIIRLENNYLTGIIPDCLSKLSNLKQLNLENNDFSGIVSEGLLKNRLLNLRCGRNFSQPCEDGKDVAVKLLSSSSKQGATEFLNEIDLLSRLNHKNLVTLLGYCNDSKQLMLVYDHMPCGSLKYHLYTSLATCSVLDWKTRLQVALDAAEGLEYLRISCTPKIINRDVKSSNILLDSTLRAKVADFGLSKIIGDDNASHVTTTIKGSIGYLDPDSYVDLPTSYNDVYKYEITYFCSVSASLKLPTKYFRTSKLTEKSDVYSFGVVLLELICGRKPIDVERSEEEESLIKWVLLYVEDNEESGRLLTNILVKQKNFNLRVE